MSEISLRDYLARLDQLAQQGSADEVLWHARHILQYYPKNVEAYRFIGRALVALGRWDEANATLRRVLSVLPNDKTTHLLLSTAYERQHRNDEAIWHLERAFEQDTNDAYLIDELKRLYREHRHIANPRIQFTTAAVARQNIRSRDYDRAIEALRASLKRSPQRGDLRLLLAEALWQRGNTIDAAETALDVLQTNPNCLEANKMLATLWLSEQRPSDARRHLNRVEAVDPYRALELVQGLSADDGSFMLPEMDYQRRVQAEMVSAQPDWLQNIDLPVGDADESVLAASASGMIEKGMGKDDSTSIEDAVQSDEDWLSHLDSIEMSYQLSTSALESTTSPLALDDENTLIEGDFADLGVPTDADESGFAIDWASDSDNLSSDIPDLSQPVSDQPLASATPGDSFEFEIEAPAENDPFHWMNVETTALSQQESPTAQEATGEDPLAWLRSSGIEVDDNAPSPMSILQEVDDIVYDDPENASEADPLNWLKDYSTDATNDWQQSVDEASTSELSQDASTRSPDAATSSFLSEVEDEFPLPDLDMIVDDWSQPPTLQESWGSNRAPQTMPLSPITEKDEIPDTIESVANPLDEWELNERLLNESLGLEALNATTQPAIMGTGVASEDDFASILNAVPNAPPTSPLPPMSDEEWDALDKAMTPGPSSSEGKLMSDSQRPDLEWDDETPKESEDESSGATGMLDWLDKNSGDESAVSESEESPVADASTGSTGILSWLAQGENPSYDVTADQVSTGDNPTGSTGILNWLAQNRPVPPTVPLGQAAAEQEFSTADLNVPDTPEWLEDLQGEERLEAALEGETGATDILDWLGDNQVPPGTDQFLAQEPADQVLPPDTNWLNELYEEAQPADAAPPATGEIMWDEEESLHAEATTDAPIGEWLSAETLTDALPDLPLTQPLMSEEEAEASAGTTPLANVEQPANASTDDSFAALADWLQTGDLVEDSATLETGDLPTMAESAPELTAFETPAEPAVEIAAEVEADWAMSEPTANPDDWAAQEEPLSFDPLLEEMPESDISIGEPAFAEIDEAIQGVVAAEEGIPVADLPLSEVDVSVEMDLASASSADEFANSLLDSGESQSLPGWMTDVTGEATTAEAFVAEPIAPEPVEAVAQSEELSWLDEAPSEQEATSEEYAVSNPDWLLEAAAPVSAVAALDSVLDDDNDVPIPEASEAAWDFAVSDAGAESDILEPVDAVEAQTDAATKLLDEAEVVEPAEGNEYYSAFEDLPTEEAEALAAVEVGDESSNAPDWLNAMVPGLDIDTTAGASEVEDVLDEDVSDDTADAAAMPDDYEWLNEIVDEETKSDIVVPAVAAQAPRFVFSRPPRWLRRLLERRGSASDMTDDSDLPAWLR